MMKEGKRTCETLGSFLLEKRGALKKDSRAQEQ
jgi:hypothetical protein